MTYGLASWCCWPFVGRLCDMNSVACSWLLGVAVVVVLIPGTVYTGYGFACGVSRVWLYISQSVLASHTYVLISCMVSISVRRSTRHNLS